MVVACSKNSTVVKHEALVSKDNVHEWVTNKLSVSQTIAAGIVWTQTSFIIIILETWLQLNIQRIILLFRWKLSWNPAVFLLYYFTTRKLCF